MISWHGKDSCITGPLWGEDTSHWWIPITRYHDAGPWCFSRFSSLLAPNCWTNSCQWDTMILHFKDKVIFFQTTHNRYTIAHIWGPQGLSVESTKYSNVPWHLMKWLLLPTTYNRHPIAPLCGYMLKVVIVTFRTTTYFQAVSMDASNGYPLADV